MRFTKLYRNAPTVKRNYPNQEWVLKFDEGGHSTFIKEHETGDLVFSNMKYTNDGNFIITKGNSIIEVSDSDSAKALYAVIRSFVHVKEPSWSLGTFRNIDCLRMFHAFIDQAPELNNELLPHHEYTELYNTMIERMNKRKAKRNQKNNP
ncbi:hypothetical protein [Aeromonas hydrophila]|uniref:hypothetical protein n=1 Tax=Aeromonas hydrophila TaxID=644 RepID=UPI00131A6090|nr:hypothetical protein [Aeromonas hydrophila]